MTLRYSAGRPNTTHEHRQLSRTLDVFCDPTRPVHNGPPLLGLATTRYDGSLSSQTRTSDKTAGFRGGKRSESARLRVRGGALWSDGRCGGSRRGGCTQVGVVVGHDFVRESEQLSTGGSSVVTERMYTR